MLLDTLVTGLAVVVLVASGVVALPWTSGEQASSARAYRVLGALTVYLGSQILHAPAHALALARARARELPVAAFSRAGQ